MSDLPPLDQPQAYVVVGPNDQRGPYALELLINEVVAGRLYDATPVWWPGLDQWTTMGAHPAVAGEVARRRAGAAPQAPVQTYQPPVAPAPVAEVQQQAASQQEVQQAAQHQPDPYAQYQPEPTPAGPTPAPAGYASAPVEQASPAPVPGADVQDLPTTGAAVAATGADEVGSAAGVPIDTTATVATSPTTVTAEQQQRFQHLVDRSRDRSLASERIRAVDDALVDAAATGATAQGFTLADRTSGSTTHELRFDGGPGEVLSIAVGRVEGDDPVALGSGHVPFSVRFQSSTYDGTIQAGRGAHGEVVVVADEWSGQATSSVELLLTLADYLDVDLAVDADAVAADVGSAVAVVSGRMR